MLLLSVKLLLLPLWSQLLLLPAVLLLLPFFTPPVAADVGPPSFKSPLLVVREAVPVPTVLLRGFFELSSFQ